MAKQAMTTYSIQLYITSKPFKNLSHIKVEMIIQVYHFSESSHFAY